MSSCKTGSVHRTTLLRPLFFPHDCVVRAPAQGMYGNRPVCIMPDPLKKQTQGHTMYAIGTARLTYVTKFNVEQKVAFNTKALTSSESYVGPKDFSINAPGGYALKHSH